MLAQSKTFTGFYISSVGDTIQGVFPDYKQWHHNPTRVAFIESATSKPVVLTPENCAKFIINDQDEYVAYNGPRIENPLQDLQVVNNKETSTTDYQYTEIVAFLRLLSRSKEAELYTFSDNRRVNLFYKLPGERMAELKFKKIYRDNQIYDIEDYKQQLSNLFILQIQDRNLNRTLEKLAYNEQQMKEFFDKLYQTGKLKLRNKKTASGWVLLAGVSVNTVKIKNDQAAAPGQKNHSSSISPLLSVGYVVPLDRNFSKYFLFPEMRVFRYSNFTSESNNGTYKHTATFKSNFVIALELNAAVNLVNQENFKMHISGGGGVKFLANNKRIDESFVLPDTSPYSSSETGLTKISFMGNISAGATFNKSIMAIVSYNFPTLIADYAEATPMLGGIQLRVGYRFK